MSMERMSAHVPEVRTMGESLSQGQMVPLYALVWAPDGHGVSIEGTREELADMLARARNALDAAQP